MESRKFIVLPIALTILVSAVVFGAGGYYLASSQHAKEAATMTSDNAIQPTEVTTATPAMASTKTFTNTKHGYSFEYPDSYVLKGVVGQEGQKVEATVADAVGVNSRDATSANTSVFSVGMYYFEITAADLEDHLGGTATPYTIDDKSGFKVVFSGGSTTNYYVENNAGTPLALVVKNNNADARSMFNSFKLTK